MRACVCVRVHMCVSACVCVRTCVWLVCRPTCRLKKGPQSPPCHTSNTTGTLQSLVLCPLPWTRRPEASILLTSCGACKHRGPGKHSLRGRHSEACLRPSWIIQPGCRGSDFTFCGAPKCLSWTLLVSCLLKALEVVNTYQSGVQCVSSP